MSKEKERPRRSRSLTRTLALAFLALSVTVLLITVAVETYFNFQTQREVIASEQQLIAQDAASAVRNFIQERFSVLEAAVELGDPTTLSLEEQEGILGSLLGLNPAFRQLLLVDQGAQELARVSRLSQAASGEVLERVDADWFDQIRQGERYIGSVYVDEVTSEPLVVVAVPAIDPFGDLQGALMAEVNLKSMWDLVDQLEVGETGTAYVVNEEGDLIAFGDVARVLRGENVRDLQQVSEFVNTSSPVDETGASISTGINGTTVVSTYVGLGTPDWAVVTEMPVREAYRDVFQSLAISGALVVAMTGLAGLVGAYVARQLSAPLRDLTETASRIAQGEIDLQAEPKGPAEVADLSRAFNSMTAQLRHFISTLEQRVADRTRNLQAAADVGRATTSVLDLDELLSQTVDLVRERFDLYYVGVFLVDEERGEAVLQAGTGEAGWQMVREGHALEVGGDSMIGQSVELAETRIALDVGVEAVHFDNPLLPETRSEMALPLEARGRVIGAVTIQSVDEAAFDESDVAVLQTMADQLAVAIDNARLFAESQEALEAERRAYGVFSREAWEELLRKEAGLGYRYLRGKLVPLSADRSTAPEGGNGDGRGGGLEEAPFELEVPVRVRGKVIGTINAHKPHDAGDWTEGERAVMEQLAQQLGVTLESARLYRDTQRRAAQEGVTREITDNIRSAASVDGAIRRAIREIGEVIGASEMVARIGTEDDLIDVSDEGNSHE